MHAELNGDCWSGAAARAGDGRNAKAFRSEEIAELNIEGRSGAAARAGRDS